MRIIISRSLLINILVCWFHFICLGVEVRLGGVWNLHSTCLILFGFATVDTRHSWTNNEGEKPEKERQIENLYERICTNSKSKSIEFSSAISLFLSLSQPHFPFVILHSFGNFGRLSSLKTNDVIGQFSPRCQVACLHARQQHQQQQQQENTIWHFLIPVKGQGTLTLMGYIQFEKV